MPTALLGELQQHARGRGLDLFGVVDARRFDQSQPAESRCDRLLPGCGTVMVLASGAPQPLQPAVLRDLARQMRRLGLRARAVVALQSRVSFAALGEAAGLGIVSPVIHRLLHPKFGPWVTVHGVVLVEGQPFGPIADASIAATFHPCCQCERPCVRACPAGVHDGEGTSRFEVCHDHRAGGGCGSHCQVVRACPIGTGQRVSQECETGRHGAEAHALMLRFGRGFTVAVRRLFWR